MTANVLDKGTGNGWSHVISAGWPARYEVAVDGVLDHRWSEWFEGLHLHTQGDQTILSGMLRDQAELHGVLDKVRDLGLSVITVRRISPPGKAGEQR